MNSKRILHIRSFGPIAEASIEIRRFNLFIGEQSIGKSTIAKLITIFTDYFTLWGVIEYKKKFWDLILESYDLQAYETKDAVVNFDYQDENIRININITAGEFETSVYEDGSLITNNADIFASILASKPFFHQENNDKLKEVLRDGGIMKPVFLNLIRNSLYIPAERIVGSQLTKLLPVISIAKEQIPNNLMRFISELGNSKELYKTYEAEILKLTYEKQSDDEYIVVGENVKIPLKFASSGIQSALPLLLVTKYGVENRDYASFVIEEPECNLFPTKQVELLRLLIKNVFAKGRILTITTHSPYLLSALNNYLYAGEISRGIKQEKLNELHKLTPNSLLLDSNECSVYSLGSDINKGDYCISLLDPKTGLVDFNYLDGISLELGEEFSRLNRLYIQNERSKRM